MFIASPPCCLQSQPCLDFQSQLPADPDYHLPQHLHLQEGE